MGKSEVWLRIIVFVLFVCHGAVATQYGLSSSKVRLPGVDIIGPATVETPATDPRIHEAPPVRLLRSAVGTPSRVPVKAKPAREHPLRPESPEGWVAIKTEDFEGAFPNDWDLLGTPTWDDELYRYHAGSWSGYCVGSSVSPPGPYPSNANSWMIYGPFSLSDASDARVDFYRWLDTEQDYDYLKWLASVDGTNFYGWQTSGYAPSWQSTYFDLQTVPTLGNLCGQSQVWIAFRFTSDESNEYEGAYIDDIILQEYTSSQPDLVPYAPSGWDLPIVPSNVTGTHTVPTTLLAGTNYVDWAGKNEGSAATADTFFTYLCLDGTPLAGWYTPPPVNPGATIYVNDYQTTIAAGSHTLMTTLDSTDRIDESNENNNRYSHSWTWVDGGGGPYEHLTITSSSLSTSFASLKPFLLDHLSLHDTVVTTEYIYSSQSGRDNPEKIRNFIKYAYQNWQTTYVLLGGDADVIPCRYAYAYAGGPASIPCDLYYSDLDGDWDANANDVFGEFADSVDMYPDVFVGRAAVSNGTAAALFVQKFLAYSSDSTAAYLSKAVLGGFDLNSQTHGESTMEFYEDTYVPSSMKPCNKVYDSHTGDHRSNLMAYLEAGQHFWIHTDHGNKDCLGCGYTNHDWLLYPNDLYGLTNGDNLTIFMSIACLVGAFDTSDCIAEHFLNAPSGGGVAALVNSREGWYTPGVNPQRSLSAAYIEACLYYLFGHATGNASLEDVAIGKSAFVPLADTDGYYRWIMYEMNLFGDPAMQVWIPSPTGVSENPGSDGPPGAPMLATSSHFRSSAVLRVRLPRSGRVRLGIYDRAGRMVKCVASSDMLAGRHDFVWDGRTDNGADVSAGIYYARLEAKQGSSHCKLVRLGKELP